MLRAEPRERERGGLTLELSELAEAIELCGEAFSVRFGRHDGLIRSLTYRGAELLRSGPATHFWRAPIDNDRGNGMPERCGVWRYAGSHWQVMDFAVERLAPHAVRLRATGRLPDVRSTYSVSYTVFSSGDMVVEAQLEPGAEELPELPRFGMQMSLPKSFETITWYGRGPHESYWDRQHGARIGVYSGSVEEQFVDYSVPQENGNKTDVRWVALTDGDGVGLLAVGEPLLSVAAHRGSQTATGTEHFHHGLPGSRVPLVRCA